MITKQAVYELERYRYENSPPFFQKWLDEPLPPDDDEAGYDGDDEHVKTLISFAAQQIPPGGLNLQRGVLPRELEAWRVLQRIPEAEGSRLFSPPKEST